MSSVVLESARLRLTCWSADDYAQLRPLAINPEVMRYVTGGTPWSDEQIHDFVARQLRTYATHGFCRWRLIRKSDDAFLGFCGAGFWRDQPDTELGWWLAPVHWRQGYATEAARVALADMFDRVQLERITSVAMVDNRASIHVMEKIGLHREHEFEDYGFRLVRYALARSAYDANLPRSYALPAGMATEPRRRN